MLGLFTKKPDHPLFDLDETARQLGELPQDDARKALGDLTFWLESLPAAAGFTPEMRSAVLLRVDEAAQPLCLELLQRYLEEPHLRDFQGTHQWRALHDLAQALATAWSACLEECLHSDKRPRELDERLPLLCVRQQLAVALLLKLLLMRYLDIPANAWRQLYAGYRAAETLGCHEQMVLAYPGHVIHTSPQRELLRTLALYVAAPETLAADQIEVCQRIAGRLSSFFDLATSASVHPYQFDLESAAAPQHTDTQSVATPGTRYFATHRAQPALHKIITQNEDDPVWRERRFGSEFTPAGKLTVLKHLLRYWAAEPPQRHLERRGIHAEVEVVHGFRLLSQLVPHIDAGQEAEQQAGALGLVATDKIEYTPERWAVSDMSAGGLGAVLSGAQGAWIKIGDLCGIRPPNGGQWWIGMLRRLHTDDAGKVHVGIELLSKRPASVWLRVLGKGAERSSNWETSSGSFAYDYLPVILLPDEHNSYLHATLLLESGKFVADSYHQMMMGAQTRDIQLTALLAEGEDFEQASFAWQAAG